MNKYRIEYVCSNGYEDEVIVYAVNRFMAFELFEEFGFEDVINVECFRVLDEDEEENE
jgi:hypothetical protein